MRIPPEQVVWLGAEALRRLAGAPLTEQQRFLLNECVQSYLPADAEQKRELERLLQSETYAEVQAMNRTMFDEAREKGMEEGRRAERLELICAMLEGRFGPVSAAVRAYLEQLSMEELQRLAVKIGTGATQAELGLPAAAPAE
jgi:hypothetical protein